MRAIHYEITCDLCKKLASSGDFRLEAHQASPVLPKISSLFPGQDLCHPCELELKAAYDKLRAEKANARTP